MGSIAKQENGHLGAEILVPDQRGGEPETEAPRTKARWLSSGSGSSPWWTS